MSYDAAVSLLITFLIIEAIVSAAALAVAVVAVLEARWWKRFALRNDPALAGLEDNLPPFVGGLLDRYRRFSQ